MVALKFRRMRTMSLLLFIVIFVVAGFFHIDAADHEKPPSAMVVGAVYCDSCFHQKFSKSSHFISGAALEVECKDSLEDKTSFRQEGKTNKHGFFKFHLPPSVSQDTIKGCSVKLISSSEPSCPVPSSPTASSLNPKSKKEGAQTFSAGFLAFKPLEHPDVCYEKPGPSLSSMKTFLPYGEIPPFPRNQNSPPLLNFPLLPRLPSFPVTNSGLQAKQLKGTETASATEGESAHQVADQKTFFIYQPPVFGIPFTPNPLRGSPPPSVGTPAAPAITPPAINPPAAVPSVQPFPPFPFTLPPPAIPRTPPTSMSMERTP